MVTSTFVATPSRLDVYPLHTAAFEGSQDHWACEQPERPWDDSQKYDFRCRSCRLHGKASLLMQGDRRMSVTTMATGVSRPARLSEILADYERLEGAL